MMQIVEFADSCNSAEQHFEKRHARGVIQRFRRQKIGSVIHGFAPGPERIGSGGSGVAFGTSANYPLEGVRVGVHKPWKNRAAGETFGLREIGGLAGKTRNASLRIRHQSHTRLELAAAPDTIRQPRGHTFSSGTFDSEHGTRATRNASSNAPAAGPWTGATTQFDGSVSSNVKKRSRTM